MRYSSCSNYLQRKERSTSKYIATNSVSEKLNMIKQFYIICIRRRWGFLNMIHHYICDKAAYIAHDAMYVINLMYICTLYSCLLFPFATRYSDAVLQFGLLFCLMWVIISHRTYSPRHHEDSKAKDLCFLSGSSKKIFKECRRQSIVGVPEEAAVSFA
jgi:hypothetical protein